MSPDSENKRSAWKDGRLDMRYLDGLRGLVAFYVVLRHSYFELADGYNAVKITREVAFLDTITRAGKLSISFFVVLSGFLLMFPLALKGRDRIEDLGRYFRRRFMRIYPPYIGALIFSLILIAVVPGLDQRSGYHWDLSLPAFTFQSVTSHLLMVHNLMGSVAYKIGHPLWSIATECQLYVLFPLVLIPLFRRLGAAGLLIPLAVILGWYYVAFHFGWNTLHEARLWYVWHFSLGMIGSMICFSKDSRYTRWMNRLPWMTIAAVAGVLTFLSERHLFRRDIWAAEMFVAVSMLSVIIALTRIRLSGKDDRNRFLRILESDVCEFLGRISYSLFLVHAPMVAIARMLLVRAGVHGAILIPALLVVAPLFSVITAVAFYHVVEKRFVSTTTPHVTAIPLPAGELVASK